ncbi:50S ribosomal protein L18 [Trifolium repens]|nr:50S ribosomal protein L18 [Trifolium repens]
MIPSLPSILSFFLGSYAMAYTSASFDRSAISFPITLQASGSIKDGREFRRSLAFVVAAHITLLVPRCVNLA